jgi:hypothetical protein
VDDSDFISNELTSRDASFVKIIVKNRENNGSGNIPNLAIDELSQLELNVDKFSAIFRHSAPYIAMHRGTVMIIHIAGYVLKQKDNFDAIMDDISILQLLGIKLVLVSLLSHPEPFNHLNLRWTDGRWWESATR